MAMLVVPVPSPASLNEVTSAPVLVSMLLVAEMKCGLSASAAVAVITTAATAEMSTKAMRRIVNLLVEVLRTRLRIATHHLPGRCRATCRRGRADDDQPVKGKE